MIFVLFICLLVITLISYNFSKYKYMSATFISSFMFAGTSFIYLIFFSNAGVDISAITVLLVILSELSVALGEFLGNRKVIDTEIICKEKIIKKNTNIQMIDYIKVSRRRSAFFFMISIITFCLRYKKLMKYAGSVSVFGVISSVREAYALGLIPMGLFLSIGYYISFITGMIYIFISMFNLVKKKRIQLCTLFPIIGFLLNIITTTSRSEYIVVFCVIITTYFFVSYSCGYKIAVFRVFIACFVFGIFFLVFGFLVRGISYKGLSSIRNNIFGYTGASLFGLNYYLLNPWPKNVYFGQYTLCFLYGLFGIQTVNGYEPHFLMNVGNSNIYTSIVKPLQDYGIIGLLLSRVLIGYIFSLIMKKLYKKELAQKSFYLLFLLQSYVIYMFFLFPMGDKAYGIFLNPSYVVKIVIAFFIVLLLGFKCSLFYKGKLMQTFCFSINMFDILKKIIIYRV